MVIKNAQRQNSNQYVSLKSFLSMINGYRFELRKRIVRSDKFNIERTSRKRVKIKRRGKRVFHSRLPFFFGL